MAVKPEEKNENKPVAWVTASINVGAAFKQNDEHPRHSLTVKLLTDGTTVGQLIGEVGQSRMYSMEVPPWGTFPPGLGQTYFWDWYDGDNLVKMADFTVFVYVPNYGGPVPLRYQIADYGEPGKNDWHRIWIVMPNPNPPGPPILIPLWDGNAIPYANGNAKIHGDMDITGPPSDWDENNLPDVLPPWK
jgi:hypothetical protein